MHYELEFNTQSGCYEIIGVTYHVGVKRTHRVVSMTPKQSLRFTYTVDGAEDTRTIHEDTQVTHNG